MGRQEDEDLVARIYKGDKKAEEELALKYRPRIQRKVYYSLGRNRIDDCKELVSDILTAIVDNLREHKFRKDSSLATYIYSITKNKIAAYFKTHRLKMEKIAEGYPEIAPTPPEILEKEEVIEALKKAIHKLKPKYKEVLYFYYYEGLSITEVGKKLGIYPRRISERKNYAIKKLRKSLMRKTGNL